MTILNNFRINLSYATVMPQVRKPRPLGLGLCCPVFEPQNSSTRRCYLARKQQPKGLFQARKEQSKEAVVWIQKLQLKGLFGCHFGTILRPCLMVVWVVHMGCFGMFRGSCRFDYLSLTHFICCWPHNHTLISILNYYLILYLLIYHQTHHYMVVTQELFSWFFEHLQVDTNIVR